MIPLMNTLFFPFRFLGMITSIEPGYNGQMHLDLVSSDFS
jgi:hypothetical protein